MSMVMACTCDMLSELGSKARAATDTATIMVPFLINTKKIGAGGDVVLKWGTQRQDVG